MRRFLSGLFRKLPPFTPLLYQGRVITRIPSVSRKIYLTFDDGPHPDITLQVLECLVRYDAKATFFLLGKNVEKHPQLVQRIKAYGHSIGNHTYSHLNGWKTTSDLYYSDIIRCHEFVSSSLFRPPYGRIWPYQAHQLSSRFHIILWTMLTQDFVIDFAPEYILRRLMKEKYSGGEIIVFHDSEKAAPRMLYTLPRFVEALLEKGFTFEPIEWDR